MTLIRGFLASSNLRTFNLSDERYSSLDVWSRTKQLRSWNFSSGPWQMLMSSVYLVLQCLVRGHCERFLNGKGTSQVRPYPELHGVCRYLRNIHGRWEDVHRTNCRSFGQLSQACDCFRLVLGLDVTRKIPQPRFRSNIHFNIFSGRCLLPIWLPVDFLVVDCPLPAAYIPSCSHIYAEFSMVASISINVTIPQTNCFSRCTNRFMFPCCSYALPSWRVLFKKLGCTLSKANLYSIFPRELFLGFNLSLTLASSRIDHCIL